MFTDVGRRSVPPMIVAVVMMVLQRIEGLSDREAADRFAFAARWKYAAGGLGFDLPGFVHTVLVDMRARLARSQRPDRIFLNRPSPSPRRHQPPHKHNRSAVTTYPTKPFRHQPPSRRRRAAVCMT